MSNAPLMAQKGQGVSAPRPIPDFSKVSVGNHIRYREYDNKPVTFSSMAVYVLVPVIVTDKKGNHVSGLARDAFRVLENGREQRIVSFEEMKPTTAPVAAPELATNIFTNVPATEDTKPRRLVILALDLVNTPFLDQEWMRRAVVNYLADNIEPDALYQLVAINWDGMRVIYDFTQDTAGLVAAMNDVKTRLTRGGTTAALARTVHMNYSASALRGSSGILATTSGTASADPGPSAIKMNLAGRDLMDALVAKAETPMLELQAGEAAASTLLAFQQIAYRVTGVPGRKSLVWLTGGFPFSIDPATASVDESTAAAAYEHAMHLLANQMISVYPVDVRGLLPSQPDASWGIPAHVMMRLSEWLMDQSARQRGNIDTMRAFAHLTGGRAFFNTNDTLTAIRRAAKDGSAYYLLSYAVDKSNRRLGWRKIDVKVANYNVRARTGYFMTQTTADPALMASMDIDTALTSPFEYTGLPVRVAVGAPAVTGEKRKVSFSMTMPPRSAQVDSADRNHLNVAIAYLVRTAEGKDAGHKGTRYNLYLNPEQIKQIETQGVGYTDTLELSPGDYTLHVVVRDNITGRMGSVTARLQLN